MRYYRHPRAPFPAIGFSSINTPERLIRN
ncbi:unnamed protein product [Medioppia subpectinata]|uniref:Uncharacterized protein n=1 Tax=Medioppia subpectinata TaxID=1979941 RepID=A0A7R9Q199_9ACAR|nr:unnamed protein product [Medioppia subpectinata]CAG2108322.1 unnamed protein product [Medioppia subpectinata]